MSWDIFIQDLPDVPAASDIPADFRPGHIGDRNELLARLRSILPDADLDDGLWGFVRTPTVDLSIGITAEQDGQVTHIVIHVHGGDGSPALVARIVRGLGLRALDSGTGGFFDPERPEAGYLAWRTFKDGLAKEVR